jgi:two-component system phosphate regulon response regulator PhoB
VRRSILVVDDDAAVHDLLRTAVDASRYEMLSAYDGVEGLAMVRKHRPDLVVLDVDMPRMDGKQVLAEIRRDLVTTATLVVMLTGQTTSEARRVGFDLGVDAYLEKPFHPGTVIRRIEYLLDLRMAATAALQAPSAPGLPRR